MYQLRWDVYGAMAAVGRPVEMAPMTALGVFFITALTTSKLGATERNFIVRLTTFNLFNLRLSLDYELPIRTF